MAGNRVRELRLRKAWTLDDLAGLADISAAHLSRYERDLKNLSPDAQVRLARALGVRVRDLFEVESTADAQTVDAPPTQTHVVAMAL